MKMPKIIIALACATSLSACKTDGETIGTLGGAAAGGVAGAAIGGSGTSEIIAIVVGAAAGAWLGGKLGKELDNDDRDKMQRSTQTALSNARPGETVNWRNPDSGNQGSVTPQQRFTNAEGQECREFRQTVTVEGQTETGYGTACRQPDGSWQVVAT